MSVIAFSDTGARRIRSISDHSNESRSSISRQFIAPSAKDLLDVLPRNLSNVAKPTLVNNQDLDNQPTQSVRFYVAIESYAARQIKISRANVIWSAVSPSAECTTLVAGILCNQ